MKFGDKVIISKKYLSNHGEYNIIDIEPKECIYLGKRVIKEGYTDSDDGCFVTKKMITCYLFAFNLSGLIYVPLNHI